VTILYLAAAVLATACASQAATRMRNDPSAAAAMSALYMLAIALTMALAAPSPVLAQARPEDSAAGSLSASAWVLAAWAYTGVLAAVTGKNGRPAAATVLGVVTTVLAEVMLRQIQGNERGPYPPSFTGELIVMSCAYPAQGMTTVMAWRCLRGTPAGHVWLGMRVVSCATATQLCLNLARIAAVASRPSSAQIMTIVAAAQPVTVLLIIAGTTASGWYPALVLAARQAALWRAYWRLFPLWRALVRAAPEVALPPQPHTRFDARFRLHRRVVEIRDAQLMLRPYCRGDAASHAMAAARSAGLAAEKSTAVAEAAMIVTALAGHRGEADHQDGDATLYVSTAGSDDLLREAARLILVSRAMRHSGIVRNITGSAAGK
jgi:Family of unknown function (DUF6545)